MSKNCSRVGISLVEILVSMGILGLILIPVFFTFSSGNRNVMVSENEFRAHTAALEILEQLVSLPFELIPVRKFSAQEITGAEGKNLPAVPFRISDNQEFKPEVEVTEIRKNGRVKFKKIVVGMSFPAAKTEKKVRKIELKTLVANEQNK